MIKRCVFAVCLFVSWTYPASCQLQQGECREVPQSEINCNIPQVDQNSVKYEFNLNEEDNRILEASITWDPPPGYDTFAVRLGEQSFNNVVTPGNQDIQYKCDLSDLFNFGSDDRHEVPKEIPFTKRVNFGYTYWISIFTVDTNQTTPRRSTIAQDCRAMKTYDCYNVTRDFNYCKNQPIQLVSDTVDPQVICKKISPIDQSSIYGLSVKWNAPVQIAPDRNLSEFRVDIHENTDEQLGERKRLVSEEEQLTYKLSNNLMPFSTYLETRPSKYRDGLKDGNYYLEFFAFVEPQSTQLSPSIYKLYTDTSIVPTCDVLWSEWGSCNCSTGNRTRQCLDPYETGELCDDGEERKQQETCGCPLFSSVHIAAMVSGVVVLILLIIAVIWKLTGPTTQPDENLPISMIRDKDNGSSGFDFKTPNVVLTPTSRFGDYEIIRDDLGVHLDQLLGSGAQGSVYKGQLRRDKNKWIDVAVKTPRFGDMTSSPKNEASKESFFKEIEFTIDVQGKKGHPNILEMLGCCTLHEPYYLVTPFMKYGDLQEFLRKCQKLKDENELPDPVYRLNQVGQLNIVRQIAKGMEFLSGLKYYMGDLAASNVLVGDHLACKVADFGLGYDLYLTDGDIKREPEAGFKFRPRWVSLETFQSRGAKVNLKSDVWSFGIVMYEVFTFGEVPYSQKWSNAYLLDQLKKGYRLDHPDDCSDRVYNIMLKCWLEDSHQRPTFTNLVIQLGISIDDLTHKESLDVGYIDDLLTSDASGISNINFELDTVFEEDGKTKSKEEDENAQSKEKGDNVTYANQKRINMMQKKSRSTASESDDTITEVKKRRPPKPCPKPPAAASTSQGTNRGMSNSHENQSVFNTDGSESSDRNRSFKSEEIDIKDFHSFKRFPDNEVLINEKET